MKESKKALPKAIRDLLSDEPQERLREKDRAKGTAKGKATKREPQELVRERERVQQEFTRLTHAVDDVKRDGDVVRLTVAADIISCCYRLLDVEIGRME